MSLATPFLLVVLFLTFVWVALVWKGIDPVRMLRSVFKSPQHHLTPASYAERERLLKLQATQGPRTGQTQMYSDAMVRLAESTDVAEMEEILQFIHATRLVNSDVKAQHFAQHCQKTIPVHAMTPTTLSAIITSLYRYTKFQIVADAVQTCFHAATGADCFMLKNELERHISIYRLVFQRIPFKDVREAIVQHLEREATALTSSPEFVRPVKLICDIDDTMISVLFDTRYPDLTVYPGVHQFVEELLHCSGSHQPSEYSHHRDLRSRITFLTARPEIMRRRSIRQLRASGFFHFTLLMGRLAHMFVGPQRIAAGKLENFENFRRLFSEYQFVFVGDNGQGDIDLGKAMLAAPEKYGVSMVLIHDIIRNHVRSYAALAKAGISVEAYRRQECDNHGIHLFTTYIGAIAKLCLHGIVEPSAVFRVIQKTTAAHTSIKYESTSQRESVMREIAVDIALVLDTMPEVEAESLLHELPKDLRDLIDVKRMGHADDEATFGIEDALTLTPHAPVSIAEEDHLAEHPALISMDEVLLSPRVVLSPKDTTPIPRSPKAPTPTAASSPKEEKLPTPDVIASPKEEKTSVPDAAPSPKEEKALTIEAVASPKHEAVPTTDAAPSPKAEKPITPRAAPNATEEVVLIVDAPKKEETSAPSERRLTEEEWVSLDVNEEVKPNGGSN